MLHRLTLGFVALSQLALIGAAHAQASKPPNLIPDASMAARQSALAKAMTVPPTAQRRGASEVLRAPEGGGKGCAVNVAPLPERREGASKLGTVNQTVVVEGAIVCVAR